MADDKDQPIIIKKKKGGGYGHHGGAWKIAYADFVTAMMAFFLVLWIVGLDVKTRNGLAEYFANPGAFKIDYRSSPYIMKTDGRPPVMNDKVEQASRAEANIDVAEAETLAGRIRSAASADSNIRSARSGFDVKIKQDGLAVEFSENTKGALFIPGTAELKPEGRQLLQAVVPTLLSSKRGLSVRAFAAKRPSGERYGAWEISTDRANSVRRALSNAGMPPDRLVKVESSGDRVPKLPDDLGNVVNDRIVLHIPFETE